MCLTIIDLATSWFDIVESPTVTKTTGFFLGAAWAIRSTYHSAKSLTRCSNIWLRYALQHSVHSWKKNGEYRQWLTDLNTARENEGRIDYDYNWSESTCTE